MLFQGSRYFIIYFLLESSESEAESSQRKIRKQKIMKKIASLRTILFKSKFKKENSLINKNTTSKPSLPTRISNALLSNLLQKTKETKSVEQKKLNLSKLLEEKFVSSKFNIYNIQHLESSDSEINSNLSDEVIVGNTFDLQENVKSLTDSLGPIFPCICCGCLYFRENVVPYLREKHVKPSFVFPQITAYFQEMLPLKPGEYLCTYCDRYVRKKNSTPDVALHNGLHFPKIDAILLNLNEHEERMCSPMLPYERLIKFYHTSRDNTSKNKNRFFKFYF